MNTFLTQFYRDHVIHCWDCSYPYFPLIPNCGPKRIKEESFCFYKKRFLPNVFFKKSHPPLPFFIIPSKQRIFYIAANILLFFSRSVLYIYFLFFITPDRLNVFRKYEKYNNGEMEKQTRIPSGNVRITHKDATDAILLSSQLLFNEFQQMGCQFEGVVKPFSFPCSCCPVDISGKLAVSITA